MIQPKLCAVCGEHEDAHHKFLPVMPNGCVCDPADWGDYVSDVCDTYTEGGLFSDMCAICDHGKMCHDGVEKR